MGVANKEAYELTRNGGKVIVICDGCGFQVWTDDSTYDKDADAWYCPECREDAPEVAP